MGCAGLGAVTGTLLSTRAGSRWGTGPTMIAARLAQPAAVALVALAPLAAGPLGAGGTHASPAQWPAGLWGAFLLAALALLFSNFRSARTEDHQLPDEDALIP